MLAAPLLLAACGQQVGGAQGDAAKDGSAAAPQAPAPVAATSPAPVPAPPGHEQDGMIPARFLGVWDYVKGSCDPASDMRMDIRPREIGFYESTGQVAGTGSEGDDVLVDLVMSGEGETWTQVTRLSLSQDGERLEVSDGLKPKVPDEYPRKRCK